MKTYTLEVTISFGAEMGQEDKAQETLEMMGDFIMQMSTYFAEANDFIEGGGYYLREAPDVEEDYSSDDES